MAMLSLPIEVLEYIAEEAIPEGFEGFSLSCKTLYASGQKFRKKHNRLRKRYRSFKYDRQRDDSDEDNSNRDNTAEAKGEDDSASNQDHGEEKETTEQETIICFSPLQLIHQISKEPLIARYIVRANFKSRDRGDPFSPQMQF